jgi:hypothetical protein
MRHRTSPGINARRSATFDPGWGEAAKKRFSHAAQSGATRLSQGVRAAPAPARVNPPTQDEERLDEPLVFKWQLHLPPARERMSILHR